MDLTDFWGRFKRTFFTRCFIFYALIGCLNAVNNILFSGFYSRFMNPNIAFVLAYITWLSISYVLNSFLSFRQPLSFVRYIKFSISYIPNFLVQNLTIFIVYNLLDAKKMIAYVIAALISGPMTYIILKIYAFSFKRKNKSNGGMTNTGESPFEDMMILEKTEEKE